MDRAAKDELSGGKEVSLVPDRLARPSDNLLSSLEGGLGP
jgi:hypothetical protein